HEECSYLVNVSVAHVLARSILASGSEESPEMSSLCAVQCGYVGFRFLRYKCSPWLILAIAPFQLCLASDVQRTHTQIRWMRAIARIDFVSVYGLLHDLLW
ncbi:MAG: hypothetical protein WCA35_28520, partial [Kovacikia sp.]